MRAGEIGEGEVLGAHPGVEALKAEVDGVGPVLDGGADAVPVAGRGEELRAREGGRWRGGEGGSGSGGGRHGGGSVRKEGGAK